MVSDWLLKKALEDNVPFTEHQYKHYLEVFGEGEVGFISISDVLCEAKTGINPSVFKLDNFCRFYLSDETDLTCDVFSPEDFDFDRYKFLKYEDLEIICNRLEDLQNEGKIKTIINPKRPTLLENKRYFTEFYNLGLPVVKTHCFETFDKFKEFVNQTNKKVVVKHIFGSEGRGTYLVDKLNVDTMKSKPFSEYIVQQELEIESEKRFILFEDELLASRIILDRTRPWELEGKRLHKLSEYKPSKEELKRIKEFFSYTGAILGCVDTVQLKDGRDLILEYNGSATGLGYPEGPYDCNRIVAQKINNLI